MHNNSKLFQRFLRHYYYKQLKILPHSTTFHIFYTFNTYYSFRNVSRTQHWIMFTTVTVWCSDAVNLALNPGSPLYKNINWIIRFPSFDMVTHGTQRKAENFSQSYWVHIMPLVFSNLWGGHTHKHTCNDFLNFK